LRVVYNGEILEVTPKDNDTTAFTSAIAKEIAIETMQITN